MIAPKFRIDSENKQIGDQFNIVTTMEHPTVCILPCWSEFYAQQRCICFFPQHMVCSFFCGASLLVLGLNMMILVSLRDDFVELEHNPCSVLMLAHLAVAFFILAPFVSRTSKKRWTAAPKLRAFCEMQQDEELSGAPLFEEPPPVKQPADSRPKRSFSISTQEME